MIISCPLKAARGSQLLMTTPFYDWNLPWKSEESLKAWSSPMSPRHFTSSRDPNKYHSIYRNDTGAKKQENRRQRSTVVPFSHKTVQENTHVSFRRHHVFHFTRRCSRNSRPQPSPGYRLRLRPSCPLPPRSFASSDSSRQVSVARQGCRGQAG